VEDIVSNGRKPGSRRSRYREEKGLPVNYRPEKPSLREVILDITCNGRDGDPDHGEQLILRAARDLDDWAKGVYLYSGGAKNHLISARRAKELKELFGWEEGGGENIGWVAKTTPRCPKCRAEPRITAENLESWIDDLLKWNGGEPIKRRVDFRNLPT
jgi:hypothetical protein